MSIYVVEPGNNIDQIAANVQVPVQQLILDNQLVYPFELAVGQALFVNDRNSLGTGKTIRSNGYAYPFISPWVLEQTLPYLSELSVFSYGFTVNGELVYPLLDDQWMVNTALNFGTRPVLTLTPLGADGNFNNQLISAVVWNEESREKLLENILEVMKGKGYLGLDIDFEYILAEDRDKFTEFVKYSTDLMHENNYTLSVALAPKTSAAQPGLLYAGKDYRSLGAIADSVLVMTYEWGYTLPHTGCWWINKYPESLMNGGFSGKRLR